MVQESNLSMEKMRSDVMIVLIVLWREFGMVYRRELAKIALRRGSHCRGPSFN